MQITGLIPAGGNAERLGKLPCSKEILPVEISENNSSGKNIIVVSEHLIRAYALAGIETAFFILKKGKWDIPEYYGDGSWVKMHTGYLIMNHPFGVPFTLDQAYAFTRDSYIALGFPDIIFHPEDAVLKIKEKIEGTDTDIILGLVPMEKPEKSDMIEFDNSGSIMNIVIKQNRTDLKYSWFIAIWSPRFWKFFHETVQKNLKDRLNGKMHEKEGKMRELYPGDIIESAIRQGFKTDYLIFETGHYTDIGTPDDLKNLTGIK